jgi:hypothetical protein
MNKTREYEVNEALMMGFQAALLGFDKTAFREQLAQEVETLLCGDNCLGVNQEHCDNIKSAVNLIRQESKYD